MFLFIFCFAFVPFLAQLINGLTGVDDDLFYMEKTRVRLYSASCMGVEFDEIVADDEREARLIVFDSLKRSIKADNSIVLFINNSISYNLNGVKVVYPISCELVAEYWTMHRAERPVLLK